MYLYNLSLQKPTEIYQSITGSFTAPKKHEIIFSKGTILELCSLSSTTGKLETLISKELYSQIRKISPFRLSGNKKDSIIILSDSGKISILEIENNTLNIIKIHQETYGKSGCRRITPGEYIGIDPRGRAIMIGAIEKQKFVYIMNRDNENKMTISSPLEAHKNNVICYDLCGLDVGYYNPLFCAIEVDYGNFDDDDSFVNTGILYKNLTYYEMELSLNYVIRKVSLKIDKSANLLIPIPIYGNVNNSNNGGVLVFCEDFVFFKDNFNAINHKDFEFDVKCFFPQRLENVVSENKRKIMMINYSIYKKKEVFYILTQSEFGDLYKIILNYDQKSNKVNDIFIEYFDTIQIATSITIISGFIFASSETGNHYLYNIEEKKENLQNKKFSSSKNNNSNIIIFEPNPLNNLSQVQKINSYSSITDIQIGDFIDEGMNQIYTINGRSVNSTLKILHCGLNLNEFGESPLAGEPINVWAIKEKINDIYDKYLIISFINATLILEIGDKITETNNSGFDTKNSTILINILSDNSYIQIIKTGIIHITKNKKSFLKSSSNIKCAASNDMQIVIGLENKEVLYFEHEENKLLKPDIKVMENEIICMDLSPKPKDRRKSKYLVVGFSDFFIGIFSLEIEQILVKISSQSLTSQVNNLKFIQFENNSDSYSLYLGLSNGILLKTTVDDITGNIQNDLQFNYLGGEVNLFKISISNYEKDDNLKNQYSNYGLFAIGEGKPILCYKNLGKYTVDLINYGKIQSVCSFSSENLGSGIVTVYEEKMSILKFENFSNKFSVNEIPLRYTPRKLLVNSYNNLIIIESDNHTMSKDQKNQYIENILKYSKNKKEFNTETINPYLKSGNWGSCIRIIDPKNIEENLDLIEFENNEAAISANLCILNSKMEIEEEKNITEEKSEFLIIGTVNNFIQLPHPSFTECNICLFKLNEKGTKIDFIFKQQVPDLPLAFCEYQNKLLCGIGNKLILYEIGKQHLLKKSEIRKINDQITKILINGQRILVGTIKNSFYLLRHKTITNQFYIFCDDVLTRYIQDVIFLDYDTIAACDKFENFFIYRIPEGADEENENDPMGSLKKWEIGFLHGASFKLNLICQFHVGDMITCIRKCNLKNDKDNNLILYITISGRIGVFIPFKNRDEVDFFIHLEMYERIEIENLSGREHLMFRSVYGPVKCVIDGDLCEEFLCLDFDKQKSLSSQLEENTNEIKNRLENMRYKIY